MVEGIADPLVAVGADWVITFANQQAARLFGKPRSEIVAHLIGQQVERSGGDLRVADLERQPADERGDLAQ